MNTSICISNQQDPEPGLGAETEGPPAAETGEDSSKLGRYGVMFFWEVFTINEGWKWPSIEK